jgi:NADPH2:quinone reductase
VFWGAFAMRDPKRNAEHVGRLMTWWSEGRIRPRIDTVVPLADGGEAIRRLASRSVIGKIVVATGGDRTPL